jgi:hypothetical protein
MVAHKSIYHTITEIKIAIIVEDKRIYKSGVKLGLGRVVSTSLIGLFL